MLEEDINVASFVYLELALGIVVEAMGEAERGVGCLCLVVESELSADGLVGVGGVVHVNDELSELDSLGVGRLVLEAKIGSSGGAPVDTEVVLLEGRTSRVEHEVSTDGNAGLSEVAEGEVTEKGPQVEEGLSSGVGACVLEATLELRDLSSNRHGPCSAIEDEVEAIGLGPFL